MKTKNTGSYIFKTFIFIAVLLTLAFTTGGGKSEYNVPIKAFSVYSSDIDIDGDNDIIVGHKTMWGDNNKIISILDNYSYGYFNTTDTTKTFPGYQENIFAVKINNDNLPDLVTFYSDFSSGTAVRYIRIYYNENGEFNNYTNFNLNSSETFSTNNFGDINGDGNLDLVVVSNAGKFWGILYNDGQGNFSAPQYHDVEDYFPSDIACADLNGDGRDDIVVGGKTEIFFSKENGFQSLFFNTITGYIQLVDFDNDGDIDIIGAHQPMPTNYYLITLIENLGDENFTIHSPYIFQPVCIGNFSAVDFNNDSLPDLLFHTQDMQHLLIFYNKGNFDIADSVFIPMQDYGELYRRSACADFDGNGYNDIATIRTSGVQLPANLNILFNDGNGNFQNNPVTNIESENPKSKTQNLHCYPNPFSTETTIEINTKKLQITGLKIYDLHGKVIKSFNIEPGVYKYIWNGRDLIGMLCNPGIYFASLSVNGKSVKLIKVIKQ